jgi:hypothetical protein
MTHKHTWTFSGDSKIIRFYLWAWDTDARQITFCKLFWAYIFAPVALAARVLWLLLWPVRIVFVRAHESDQRRIAEWKANPPKQKEEVPGRIADFFAREWPRRAAKFVGFGLLIPLGLAVAGALSWSLYMLVAVWFADGVYWFFHTEAWQTVAILAGYALVVLLTVPLTRFLEPRLKARKRRKHAAGEPTLTDVLVEGAKAVKSNTCPRIEVRR